MLIIREWGRIGRSGQVRIISYQTKDEARQLSTNSKR